MRLLLREIRRAPARIVATIVALALAVGAIGVLAIPDVAASSLREAAEREGLAHVALSTTDTGVTDINRLLAGTDNIERVEAQVETVVGLPDGSNLSLVGSQLVGQQIEVVQLDDGVLPTAVGDVVVASGVAQLGDLLDAATSSGTPLQLRVVGIGGTSARLGGDFAYTGIDTARVAAGLVGANRLVIQTSDTSERALRSTTDDIQLRLRQQNIYFDSLPITTADGRHPVEDSLEQVSTLVGLLGIVAGIVALVLLASTTNTLITERAHETAVMRALGARRRPLRRRLRRLAISIAAAGVLIGVPLGIVLSNVIARLVLQEFVGLTPAFAVSIPVMIASALFGLIGARIVAAHAARRVTRAPLADALCDRDGSPFGRRWSERLAARVGVGGLLDRCALRGALHHRARALAMVAQVAAAVGALMIIASIATTINDFNAAEFETWNWATSTAAPSAGLDISRDIVSTDARSEVGIEVIGELDDWEVDVRGVELDTAMFARRVDEGAWFAAADEAVVSSGFAHQTGIEVGDSVDVRLPSTTATYVVAGLYPDRGRTVFVGVESLASTLGTPTAGNVLYSLDDPAATTPGGLTEVTRLADLRDDDGGRQAILLIFGAIGLIIVAVAGLAVASGVGVSVYERRHEFATLQAIGGRRRTVFRVIADELVPLGIVGVGLGLMAGYVGGRAIAESFERADAVEIGFTYAAGIVPVAVAVSVGGLCIVGALAMRGATRRPIAVTLRSAA